MNSGKGSDLGTINERRSRKQRATDTNLQLGEGIQKAYGQYDTIAAPAERYIGNASWNSINASKRPTNVGNINAFQKRQKEQTSQVLEQTDYSHFTPLTSRKVDVNNLNRSTSAKHQRFYSNVGFGP